LDHIYLPSTVELSTIHPLDLTIRQEFGRDLLVVADTGNDRICEFWLEPAHRDLWSTMSGNNEDASYEFNAPRAVAMLPDGGMILAGGTGAGK
jgi:hypothetical protein